MPKRYSRSFGVSGVRQGIKLAKTVPKLHEISPKSVLYRALEYSGGLKTFPNDYEWV